MVSIKIKAISEDVLKASDLISQLTGRDCETWIKKETFTIMWLQENQWKQKLN